MPIKNKHLNQSKSAQRSVMAGDGKLSTLKWNKSAPANGFDIGHICDLNCGAEGVCERVDSSLKCVCPFGKSGNGCMEDIKIRTRKFSNHSWLAFAALRGAYKTRPGN
ncbi:unnamed protein product [Ceratitis capitata]|uniref:(Mediterranean fruit fly) hypothetical protein n=1 Tax=Ceratitis capitata TaxID=7213 RepID=A0A811VKD3_CERCA|nr:unnamed protein product [Ceratitis capitata]